MRKHTESPEVIQRSRARSSIIEGAAGLQEPAARSGNNTLAVWGVDRLRMIWPPTWFGVGYRATHSGLVAAPGRGATVESIRRLPPARPWLLAV